MDYMSVTWSYSHKIFKVRRYYPRVEIWFKDWCIGLYYELTFTYLQAFHYYLIISWPCIILSILRSSFHLSMHLPPMLSNLCANPHLFLPPIGVDDHVPHIPRGCRVDHRVRVVSPSCSGTKALLWFSIYFQLIECEGSFGHVSCPLELEAY